MEELELFLRHGTDMRFDGSLIRESMQCQGSQGDVRECYNEVEQEDDGRQSMVQKVMQRTDDFLRRIIAPVGGQGGVTLSCVCLHCHRYPLEDQCLRNNGGSSFSTFHSHACLAWIFRFFCFLNMFFVGPPVTLRCGGLTVGATARARAFTRNLSSHPQGRRESGMGESVLQVRGNEEGGQCSEPK